MLLNQPKADEDEKWILTYLFHDYSPVGDRHPSILLCKLLAVTRATKLTHKQSH